MASDDEGAGGGGAGAGGAGAGGGGAGAGGAGAGGAPGGGLPVPPVPLTLPNLQPPGELDVDSPGKRERWLDWQEAYERYLLLSGANVQPENFQAAILLQSIGVEARKIYKGFVFGEGETKDCPKTLIKKYDEYFLSETRDFIERLKFSRRVQQPHETFEQYLSDLRFLASTCNFCTPACRDARIMDRILDGHKSDAVKEKLTRSAKLDLKTTLNICRAMELNDENKKVVMNKAEEVSKVSHYPSKKSEQMRCKFCCKNHRLVKSACPAYGKTCYACQEPNHFPGSDLCKGDVKSEKSNKPDRKPKGSSSSSKGSKSSNRNFHPKKKVHAVCDDDEASDCSTEGSVSVVSDVSAISDPKARPLYCKMKIDNSEIVHQIDPGATVCILPVKYVGDRSIRDEPVTLKMWNGSSESALGKVKIKVKNVKTNKKWNVDYVVVENNNCIPLLSRKAAESMGLITVNYDAFDVCSVNTDDVKCEFPRVFDSKLGSLPGGPAHLTLEEGAEPVVRPPRTLPESLKDSVLHELNRHISEETLCKVERPTDWVNQMSVVKKKSGAIRICVDPRPLNLVLKREHFMLPVLDDVLPKLSGAKVFSTCDLKQGYHHVELDEESSFLTTFATPFGRYRWLRLPFGLKVSSEIFQKRLCMALEGLDGVQCVADDVIVYGKDADEHNANLRNLLIRCDEHGIKLNPEKCKFNVPEISFLGHIVSASGLKADPAKIEAIVKMEAPTDVAAVERLRGTVTYLSRYVPKLSEVMRPISVLTHKDVEWSWGEPQEKAFKKLKKLLTESPILAYYDPKSELIIQCDASQFGIGAALMQNGKPIAYASRALTDTESRYAIIEKEMLAIVFALEKWHQFTYGRPVIVHSDHKPLHSITRKPLDRAPKRLQSMLIRALAYDIKVEYLEGKKMLLADTLSRAYISDNVHRESEFESVNAVNYLPMREERIADIRAKTQEDPVLTTLKTTIQHGWPAKDDVPLQIREYYGQRDELAVTDGLIFRGERLVIPKGLRNEILSELHTGHTGIEGSLRRAREMVYWPGMTNDVREHTQKCETCREFEQSQPKEPLMNHELPSRPWQKVGADLLTLNDKDYLVTVDYYSNFWEIDRLYDTASKTVIQKLKAHFSRYGIPEQLVTDNGPQFASSSFRHFTIKYDIQHTTSSPHHPKSNGKAESAVKAAKRILKKTAKTGEDPYLAILNVRNTPQQGIGVSPAQRLMGRRTKTLLPTAATLLNADPAKSEIADKLKFQQTKQKFYYDRTAKPLKPLLEGDTVRAKPYQINEKSWEKATVTKRLDDRSYEIETDSGTTLRRNRVHLRASNEKPTPRVVVEPDLSTTAAENAAIPESEEVPPTPSRPPKTPAKAPKVAKVPAKVPAKIPKSPVVEKTPYVSKSGRTSKFPSHFDSYVT